MIEFERPEFRLRVGQYVFDRGELHQMLGISRTEGEALAAIDHGAPKAECDRGDAVGEIHRRDRDRSSSERTTPEKSG